MRTRAFWLASAVIFLDEVVFLALVPLLPYYSERFDLTKTETGFLVSAYPLLVLVACLPAGFLCDRRGARPLMIVGTVLLVAATVGFAYADSTWQLFASRAVQGFGSGLTATAGMAIIANSARVGQRGKVISLAVALQGASAVVGPVVGGYGASELGIRTALLLPAAFGMLVIIASVRTSLHVTRRLERPQYLLTPLRDPDVRAASACMLTLGAWGGAVQTLGPLRLGEAGYSAAELGTVFVVAALIGLALTPIVGALADAHGSVQTMLVWSALVSVLLVALALAAKAIVVAGLLAALLPLARVGGALAYMRGAEYAPLGGGMGSGFGIAVSAWSVGAVVGPPCAGAIADHANYALAFAVFAAANAALTAPMVARQSVPQSGAT